MFLDLGVWRMEPLSASATWTRSKVNPDLIGINLFCLKNVEMINEPMFWSGTHAEAFLNASLTTKDIKRVEILSASIKRNQLQLDLGR